MPVMSRPASRAGIASFWIAVGSVKPRSAIASVKVEGRLRAAKSWAPSGSPETSVINIHFDYGSVSPTAVGGRGSLPRKSLRWLFHGRHMKGEGDKKLQGRSILTP